MKNIKLIAKVLCIIFALPMAISMATMSAEPFVCFCHFGAETLAKCLCITGMLLGITIAIASVTLAIYAVYHVLSTKVKKL